ncbi:ead/Ea22-like family protein [Salmonella enterica subsp. enterica serovar Newport]|nr:ead/Ea22-like family protein [Salmonella enterica subsp. enterica serovar Newport]
MTALNKQALLGADKHANQHRLSRLIIEANSAELRAIAEAVEQYTDQLIAALEAEEKHIAELESKNANLRTIAHEQNELAIKANLDSINDATETDRLYKRIAETDQRNAALTARIEPMDRRIAELERSETQLINERDYAESALNDAYKAVMGQAPEWSNWFSFENAIDEIELACEQWRNQTDDVIQFRQRIQELEARTVNLPKRSVGEVMHMSGFSRDYAEGWCAGNDNAIHEIRTAGIKVKGE